MKTLLILRHAKSSWKNTYLADHDRPLNKRGKQDAPRMGKLIRDEDLMPDVIISSTANRAISTAEEVALASDFEGEIKYTRDFYHAWVDTFIDIIQNLPDEYERVMIVGHNPGLEELVGALTGQGERMPTAALAHIQLPIDQWQDLDEETEGELLFVFRPKEIY